MVSALISATKILKYNLITYNVQTTSKYHPHANIAFPVISLFV